MTVTLTLALRAASSAAIADGAIFREEMALDMCTLPGYTCLAREFGVAFNECQTPERPLWGLWRLGPYY